MYVCKTSQRFDWARCGEAARAYIYLGIFKPFFEVVVYRFVGNLADQGQIGDANLLLLGRLKDGAFDWALSSC